MSWRPEGWGQTKPYRSVVTRVPYEDYRNGGFNQGEETMDGIRLAEIGQKFSEALEKSS